MEISRRELETRYASFTDDQLLAIDPNDLTELAQQCYRAEVERRRLPEKTEPDEGALNDEEPETDAYDESPDWLDTAVTACSFQAGTGRQYAQDAEQACAILDDAGIPSQVVNEHHDGQPDLLNVMVPSSLSLKAISILDRDLFNAELEETWRIHFDQLPDEDLRALHTDDLCAGLLDRAARLKRVYEEALLRRGIEP